MLRTVIVGPSECGKTTLGNTFQRQYAARGIPGLGCSIFPEQWPGCKWATADLAEFVAFAKRARGCVLCVDEAGQSIARKPEAEWLFTTSRHNLHDLICMSHGGTQFTPTMRNQFSVICLFASSPNVCDLWAEEFNEPRLMEAQGLDRYEFLLKRRFQPIRRVKLAL
jgi:GTPase SAR1 family protein